MTNLSSRKASFIQLMTKGEEHRRKGFRLLKEQHDRALYFDALERGGFFDPGVNPPPVAVKAETGGSGAVRIPYWDALSYLVECGREAGQKGDRELAEKVMSVVRGVLNYRDRHGEYTDNYHTYRECAAIMGLVPLEVLAQTDIQLVSRLISSRFDRDGAAVSLDKGLLEKLLWSDKAEHWRQATCIVEQILVWEWEPRKLGEHLEEEPRPLIDSYWLCEMMERRAPQLGRRDGPGVCALLQSRVRDLFSRGARRKWSYLARPAVEDHVQNGDQRSIESAIVGGFRDALAEWALADSVAAAAFVDQVLRDDCEMVRRVGIFVVAERWDDFSSIFASRLDASLFTLGHHHELFGLLQRRFDSMPEPVRQATLRVIREVAFAGPNASEEERDLESLRWLWALEGSSYGPAHELLMTVRTRLGASRPEHPDFLAYSEFGWGYGQSPYSVPEIVALALGGELRDAISAFQPQRTTFSGPTAQAFANELEQAARQHPREMLSILAKLDELAVGYASALVRGFKAAWESEDAAVSRTWWSQQAWPQLMRAMETLARKVSGSTEEGEDASEWLLATCADLLRSGARNDEHAYPAVLLENGWSVLLSIFTRTSPGNQVHADPMGHAINSLRGRAVEGIIEHVLRECRLADKSSGGHADAWESRVEFFDQEVARLRSGNFEFATLMGAYLANLEYLSPSWFERLVSTLFSGDDRELFRCAVFGLAFARPTSRSYALLRDSGALERALEIEDLTDSVRARIVERIVLGYMWGGDALESPSLRALFGRRGGRDLTSALLFLRKAESRGLTPDQQERLFDLWSAIVHWASQQQPRASSVMARSAGLAKFVEVASGRGLDLLLAVAPSVASEFALHEFAAELVRLGENSPGEVASVLECMFSAGVPEFDHDGRLVALLERLAERGQRSTVLALCTKLHDIPGAATLYRRLTGQA